MKKHRERKLVPYTPEQVFDVVADVEHYPDFLPWIDALTVHRRWEEDGVEHLEATMVVAAKTYRDKARTKVRLDRPAGRITVDLLDGPFHHLHNTWDFAARAPRGTEINFYIEFQFKKRIYQLLMNRVFGEAARRMVGGFTDRMKRQYG